MTDTPETSDAGPPGRALTGRSATVVGVLMGLVLVALAATALAVTRGGTADTSNEPVVDEHVEVDPLTDRPIVDPCDDAPQMCGEDAGSDSGPCDDASMCGPVTPGTDEQEIDAGTGPCTGELCGDVGPGEDDGTGA